jgi:hypothetical protein
MANAEKKDYKPSKYLDLSTFNAEIERMGGNTVDHELHINKDVGCMHHETVWNDQKTGKPHQYYVSFPILPSSAIICTTDAKTKKQSLCLYVDIYRNWPTKDANGDAVMQFLVGSHKRYCESLDSPEMLEIKKKILARTKQYDTKEMKDANEAMRQINALSRTKSPVLYPEFDEKHEKFGQVDESKSPYFILKIWENELKGKPVDGDLIINNGTQKVFTKIYDHTKGNFHTEACTTEEEASNVIYHKGGTKMGESLFRLEVKAIVMGLTQYFPMEKKGDSQFKCSRLNVTKKIPVGNSYAMTAEEQQALMNEMLELEGAKDFSSSSTKPPQLPTVLAPAPTTPDPVKSKIELALMNQHAEDEGSEEAIEEEEEEKPTKGRNAAKKRTADTNAQHAVHQRFKTGKT